MYTKDRDSAGTDKKVTIKRIDELDEFYCIINSCPCSMLSTFQRRPACGLIIMISCQSVQVFEWRVAGDNNDGW